LKESRLYGLYWRLADPDLCDLQLRETDFYRALLQGLRCGATIFDVGANEGNKSSVFLKLGAMVVAVDPDATNQAALRDRFLRLRLRRKSLAVVGAALSDRTGVETFWVDEPGSAKNTLNKKWVETLRESQRFGQPLAFLKQMTVQTMTLEDLIATFGEPFFVKIDVEGSEPDVLRGLNRAIPFVSFEVNLPEFRVEGLECVRLLERLDPCGEFNYTVDCRTGLAMSRWLPAGEFADCLRSCSAISIDVVWRSKYRSNG
jgi:FkbM family methyltransferase